jgi:hypothetical protein
MEHSGRLEALRGGLRHLTAATCGNLSFPIFLLASVTLRRATGVPSRGTPVAAHVSGATSETRLWLDLPRIKPRCSLGCLGLYEAKQPIFLAKHTRNQ